MDYDEYYENIDIFWFLSPRPNYKIQNIIHDAFIHNLPYDSIARSLTLDEIIRRKNVMHNQLKLESELCSK